MFFSAEAKQLAKELRSHTEIPWVIALRGDLGAGKTTFTKALLSHLGFPADQVQSPTFLKLLEYELNDGSLVVHMDGYRIEDSPEAWEKLALESYTNVWGWVVEWPEVFLNHLKKNPLLARSLGIRQYLDIEFLLPDRSLKFEQKLI